MSSKICRFCGQEKELKDFAKRSELKDGRRATCKICFNLRQRERRLLDPEKYRSYERGLKRKRDSKLTRKYGRDSYVRRSSKAREIYDNKCSECGETDPVVLQWHHRKPGNKEGTSSVVSKVIAASMITEDIMLLCANCHIRQDIKDETNKRGSCLESDQLC